MANNFDEFPFYDPLIEGKEMSAPWIASLSAFLQNLVGYLSQFGMFMPIVTTAQRNSIQVPQEGQFIYNIDAIPGPPRTAQIQVWQVKAGTGAWRVFTTV